MPVTMHNVIFWGAATCFFAFLLFIGINIGIYQPDEISAGLSPRAYPRAVMLLLLCAAAYLFVENFIHHKRVQEHTEEIDSKDTGEVYSQKKLLLLGILILLYCFSVPYLGLALASGLAFALHTRLNGESRIGRMLCIGLALGAGLYYFFLYAAAVPLPRGPLGLFSGVI